MQSNKQNIRNKIKLISVLIKNGTICLQEVEILAWKIQKFPVLYDNRVKGFLMWDMTQNISEKTAENVDFVEIVI